MGRGWGKVRIGKIRCWVFTDFGMREEFVGRGWKESRNTRWIWIACMTLPGKKSLQNRSLDGGTVWKDFQQYLPTPNLMNKFWSKIKSWPVRTLKCSENGFSQLLVMLPYFSWLLSETSQPRKHTCGMKVWIRNAIDILFYWREDSRRILWYFKSWSVLLTFPWLPWVTLINLHRVWLDGWRLFDS